jgi:hypothetical protein
MKKATVVICALLLVLALLPGKADAQMRMGFKAYGGLAYLGGGDLNTGGAGFGEFIEDLLGSYPYDGEFAPVHLGMNFGGEFLLQFSPNMGVGLGVGYISAAKESEIEPSPAISGVDFLWSPKVSAIPITASFYYYLPSGGNLKIFFNLGLGYYLAKTDFEYHWAFFGPINWDAATTGGGLGFHGGLGLEYSMTPMIGIIAEIKGRYAAFSNFEGSVEWTYPGSSGSDTFEGPLWIGDLTFGSLRWTWLWIDEVEPALGGVKKAKVDFSGFSFVIGIIVRF